MVQWCLLGAIMMMPSGLAAETDGTASKATFAGGCFWCTEAVYAQIKGVQSVTSGYIGGQNANPTYEQVCTGRTGHAEAVEIEYDPQQVAYEKLLEVFFSTHDPTTKNRQGADVGTQYRSGVYYHDDAQKKTAEAVIAKLDAARVFPSRIVTEVMPAATFYPAEKYHQDYFANNPHSPTVRRWCRPRWRRSARCLRICSSSTDGCCRGLPPFGSHDLHGVFESADAADADRDLIAGLERERLVGHDSRAGEQHRAMRKRLRPPEVADQVDRLIWSTPVSPRKTSLPPRVMATEIVQRRIAASSVASTIQGPSAQERS
jgi:peptide-methionine (S)-S-oxide reductase